MPPFTFDLTINLATLAGVVALVWKASALVSELRSVRGDLQRHTESEEKHFQGIEARFEQHGARLGELETFRKVVEATTKR